MASRPWAHGAFAVALGIAGNVHAATDADLDAIRNEIRQLKESYEARIRALEERLKAAEAAPPPAAPPAAPPASDAAPSAAPGVAAFNPAISAVLQGAYINLSQDPNKYKLFGFAPSGDIAPGPRSFSIAESELNLSASVDHLFAAALTFSLSPNNDVEVEEAYAVATALPYGITPKFGRFFSGLGYLNQQHQHVWDFYDAPLVYQAFFGGQYTQNGVQVKWVAPTDTFLELGGEGGSGTGFPGNDRNRNGVGDWVAYVHAGGDAGASNSWLAGLSYLHTAANERAYSIVDTSGIDTALSFSGRSDIAVADFVWKWAPNGNASERNFKLQGEYMWRRESGDLGYDTSFNPSLASTSAYSSRQRGFYVQGVYQFMPEWRVGARYDWLDSGTVSYGDNAAYFDAADFHPQRASLMIDWTPSEFSRLRLQYSQAKLVPGVTDNQWFLQYILTLGAHGAHRY
jgi:hypothetical protein